MEKGITHYENLGGYIAKEFGFNIKDSIVTQHENDYHYTMHFSSGRVIPLNSVYFADKINEYFSKNNFKSHIIEIENSKQTDDFSIKFKVDNHNPPLKISANFLGLEGSDILEIKVREFYK
jgi:hypothetical protein